MMEFVRDHLVAVERDLIHHSLSVAPREAVGVVWDDGMVTHLVNSAEDERRFHVSQEDLISALALRPDNHVYAIYHSHPSGRVRPSTADVEAMVELDELGLCVFWAIVALTGEDATTHLYALDPEEDTPNLVQHLYYAFTPPVPESADQ